MKDIKVSDEIWEKLMKMKIDQKEKSINNILEKLI